MPAPAGPPGRPPRPPVSADAWAVVDGREIKRDEVEKAYRRTAQTEQTPSEEEALGAKLNLLNELIVQDMLLAKAKELKIELPDTELDTAYAEARKNIPEEAFEQELKPPQPDAGGHARRAAPRPAGAEGDRARGRSKIAITDQDVTAFFDANRAQFNRPEDAYRIAQIVVTPVRDQQTPIAAATMRRRRRRRRAKAQMLMERLKQGAQFGELASDFSEDPQSAQRGGDLGFVPLSALQKAPPALRDAVLKSAPGTVSVVSNGRRSHARARRGEGAGRPARS